MKYATAAVITQLKNVYLNEYEITFAQNYNNIYFSKYNSNSQTSSYAPVQEGKNLDGGLIYAVIDESEITTINYYQSYESEGETYTSEYMSPSQAMFHKTITQAEYDAFKIGVTPDTTYGGDGYVVAGVYFDSDFTNPVQAGDNVRGKSIYMLYDTGSSN